MARFYALLAAVGGALGTWAIVTPGEQTLAAVAGGALAMHGVLQSGCS